MDEEIGDQLPQSQTQNFQQSPTQFQPPAQQQNFQQSQNHLPPPPQNFQQMPPIQNISQNTMNFGQSLPNPPSDTNFEQQRKADQQRIEFQKAEQFRLQSEDMRVRMEQQRNLDLQRFLLISCKKNFHFSLIYFLSSFLISLSCSFYLFCSFFHLLF